MRKKHCDLLEIVKICGEISSWLGTCVIKYLKNVEI